MNNALSTIETAPAAPHPRRPRYGLWLLLLLAASGMAVVLWAGFSTWHLPMHGQFSIDGDTVQWADPSGWEAAGAIGGLMIALLVILLVVPLALLLGVALPLVIVALVLAGLVAGALGLGLVLLAPLVVPLAIAWWIWRLATRSAAVARPATPASPRGADAAKIEA